MCKIDYLLFESKLNVYSANISHIKVLYVDQKDFWKDFVDLAEQY